MLLSFDPQAPPERPPAECTRPLLWRVSRGLWAEHQPSTDQLCLAAACRGESRLWPCQPHRDALLGMLAAVRPRRRTSRDESDSTSVGGRW
jgi:hypothetical protein